MSFPDPYPQERWPLSARQVEGEEFDWFARDRAGQLAVLTSAGRGFIPQIVFSATVVPYNDLIAAIACRTATSSILEFSESGRYHDWKVFSEHGLFAYDFYDVHRVGVQERGGYDLICRPLVPAMIAELPERVVLALPLIDIVFGISDLIPLSLIATCPPNTHSQSC